MTTYAYQLIVDGEQWGKPVRSVSEANGLIGSYRQQHPEAALDRVLVGRMISGQGGRGVWPATSFATFPVGGDPDTVYWHRRVRDVLNVEVRQVNFFVWLRVRGDGASTLDERRFAEAVERWLKACDPDSPPDDVRNRFVWDENGLHVELSALGRRKQARREPPNEIVGNPEPAIAFYTR